MQNRIAQRRYQMRMFGQNHPKVVKRAWKLLERLERLEVVGEGNEGKEAEQLQ